MMLGEPTLKVATWDPFDDPIGSPFSSRSPSSANAGAGGDFFLDSLSALHRFLPSNNDSDSDLDMPLISCDQFRMFEFKVRRCARGRSHDWTECPYAHPGEKARRRDPRKYHYSGSACPDFRKGNCPKGDSCDLAHGVFECWLHPARYRTQPCKDGLACHRRVCFFAHTAEQLRLLPGGHHSPRALTGPGHFDSDSPSDSPPTSPQLRVGSLNSVSELMRNLQLAKMQMSTTPPHAWVGGGSGFGSSPRGAPIRPAFCSLPSTPTRTSGRCGPGPFDLWEHSLAEEPVMERVESGRDLRARMYAKLSKENSMASGSGPNVDWVSDLLSET